MEAAGEAAEEAVGAVGLVAEPMEDLQLRKLPALLQTKLRTALVPVPVPVLCHMGAEQTVHPAVLLLLLLLLLFLMVSKQQHCPLQQAHLVAKVPLLCLDEAVNASAVAAAAVAVWASAKGAEFCQVLADPSLHDLYQQRW